MNLLKNNCIGGLFKSKWFPLVPQLFMLAVFILLIAGGLGITANNPDFIYRLRYTNLANLIVWTLWWPLIIIAAVFLGRFWCTVCPMELITYWTSRIGLQQQVPQFLKSGWIVTIFYAVIWIVGVQVLAINRVPHQMALYMMFLIIVAADISLIFQKRAFCSYVCPIGHMLGLYSLISPFEWRADDLSTCKSCKTKDCVTTKNNYQLTSRSCTSNLYPATISDNRDCLLCTQCLKACPNKNIRFSSRRPFMDFFRDINLRPAQVGFIMLIGAFVVYEILSEWPVSFGIMMWLPEHIISALGISGPMVNFVWPVIMFIILPVLLLLILGTLAKLLSGWKGIPFFATIKTFALLLLPTIAGAHIIKSILKMSSHIPYWKNAIFDPKGMETAQNIMAGGIVLNNSVTNAINPVVSFTIVAILLLALAATMWIFCQSKFVQKHHSGVKLVLLLSVLAYWTIFGLAIFNWRLG
ncbi:MAG: 4Fe-4S binding protein [Sedimentisphaerales bacterium]|nr:4Fe-4S binding protein [Sedimentisphaerales bacterium]